MDLNRERVKLSYSSLTVQNSYVTVRLRLRVTKSIIQFKLAALDRYIIVIITTSKYKITAVTAQCTHCYEEAKYFILHFHACY